MTGRVGWVSNRSYGLDSPRGGIQALRGVRPGLRRDRRRLRWIEQEVRIADDELDAGRRDHDELGDAEVRDVEELRPARGAGHEARPGAPDDVGERRDTDLQRSKALPGVCERSAVRRTRRLPDARGRV